MVTPDKFDALSKEDQATAQDVSMLNMLRQGIGQKMALKSQNQQPENSDRFPTFKRLGSYSQIDIKNIQQARQNNRRRSFMAGVGGISK